MKSIFQKFPLFIRTRQISTALTLFLMEGIAAFCLLLTIPTDSESGGLFGLSASRLALLTLHLFLLLIIVYLLFFDRSLRFSLLKRLEKFITTYGQKWIAVTAVLLMAVTFLTLQILLSIYLTTGSFREFAYYQRLLPTLGWLFFIGLQLLFGLLFKNHRGLIALVKSHRPALIPTSIVFIFFFCVALFASTTGIGLKVDKYGWGAPGVPLMEWQIWFSILFAFLAAAILGGATQSNISLTKKDLFICLGIWLAAFVIWDSQPVPPGFFATPGREPNFEIYPFSDGAFYDFYAQNIIIGNGYIGGQIPPRPLFILFLAISHFIAGQDYTGVVTVQTIVLALIPVVIYLLGRVFHSTTAGLAAASMAILRELTAILSTPFTDDVSNSKLLFADLPTTLFVALVTFLIFLWLRDPWKKNGMQMAAGLAMGILLLIRTQSLLLLPVFFLIALVVYRKKFPQFALDFGLFILIMGVCIAPWLFRNYAIAGQFIFDHPESQSRVMAQRYDFNGDFASLERQPGEDTGVYSARLSDSITQTILDHPLYVAEFVTAHFLNNEISDLLILPLRNGVAAPAELVFPTTPFWQEWNGQVSWKQSLLLAANLLLISLGIGVSWKRHKLLGLLPLAVNLTYNLSTSIARYSGWRYLLPVDWITYFYFAIGLVALLSIIFKSTGKKQDKYFDKAFNSVVSDNLPGRLLFPPLVRAIVLVAAAILVGSSLLLAERIIPRRYTAQDNNQVVPDMLQNEIVISSGIDLKALSLIESQPNAFIVKGRALYPRFYNAGDGEAKTAKTGYEPGPDARLIFLVASQPDGLTIFRTETSPLYFPNGADVSIVGCQHPLYAQAFIITVHGSQERTYISTDAGNLICEE